MELFGVAGRRPRDTNREVQCLLLFYGYLNWMTECEAPRRKIGTVKYGLSGSSYKAKPSINTSLSSMLPSLPMPKM
jgi:hypothetical protein